MAENEKTTLISLRLTDEDIAILNRYMSEKGIDSRSEAIRSAIRNVGAESEVKQGEDGIYVRLNQIQLLTLDNMKKQGIIYDEESYIRQLVIEQIVPKDAKESSTADAFKAAQQKAEML
ncbi:MAG: ribbon-helix-helix domain-containing protein [Methanomethylophilus sp.]|jgi:metal-responsive CopG/Arc/MetJ family transcriptional regulator